MITTGERNRASCAMRWQLFAGGLILLVSLTSLTRGQAFTEMTALAELNHVQATNNPGGVKTNVFDAGIPSNGAGFGDVDNDGDLDLYVTAVDHSQHYLYINQGTNAQGQSLGFVEDAQARCASLNNGVDNFGFGMAFGDYDRDGNLDMFTGEWRQNTFVNPGDPNNARLLRNTGGGHFADATQSSGLTAVLDTLSQTQSTGGDPDEIFAFSPRFVDLDRDGHQDLVIGSDFKTSRIFWNDGDSTFTDGSAVAQIGSEQNGMGSTVGDFDGDGQFDWYVTSIYNQDEGGNKNGNRLFRNLGNRVFDDVTAAAGVRSSVASWNWGSSFFDYDNDGDEDLIVTNGWGSQPYWAADQTVLYRNDGNATYTEMLTVDSGIDDIDRSRGLLVFDYDSDGARIFSSSTVMTRPFFTETMWAI